MSSETTEQIKLLCLRMQDQASKRPRRNDESAPMSEDELCAELAKLAHKTLEPKDCAIFALHDAAERLGLRPVSDFRMTMIPEKDQCVCCCDDLPELDSDGEEYPEDEKPLLCEQCSKPECNRAPRKKGLCKVCGLWHESVSHWMFGDVVSELTTYALQEEKGTVVQRYLVSAVLEKYGIFYDTPEKAAALAELYDSENMNALTFSSRSEQDEEVAFLHVPVDQADADFAIALLALIPTLA